MPVKAYCSVNKWYIYIHVLVQIHSSDSFFWVGFISCVKYFKSFIAPFYGWGSAAWRLHSHYEEVINFWPLSYNRSEVSQKSWCQLFFNSHVLIANSDVMFSAIWYHLHNIKSVKNTYGEVLLLVKIKAFSLQLH